MKKLYESAIQMLVLMSFLYGAPAEAVKAHIEEAAKPLGLMKRPYERGVSHVQELAVFMMRYEAHALPTIDRFAQATNKRVRQRGEPLDTEGTFGDALLLTYGFFPEFLLADHKTASYGWYKLMHKLESKTGLEPTVKSEDPRNVHEYIRDAIKKLYHRSPNPFLKEQRTIIAASIDAYVKCMNDARMKFWEDNPNVAESITRLLAAKTKGEQEMNLSQRIAALTQTDFSMWDGVLGGVDYRSDN